MDLADKAIVYFNPHTIAHKKLKPITTDQVQKAFGRADLVVLTDSTEVLNAILEMDFQQKNLLLMSSGNFDGMDFKELSDRIVK
jgi:UDP-N-acetylmuramate: L-alanyl-gamma-D-glutamyl-meso-diaminopimelate ligase